MGQSAWESISLEFEHTYVKLALGRKYIMLKAIASSIKSRAHLPRVHTQSYVIDDWQSCNASTPP